MKIIALILALIYTVIALASNKTIQVTIEGMTCSGCKARITKALEKIDEIEKIDINVEKGLSIITAKKDKELNLELIKKTITDAGYKVKKISTN